MQKTLSSIIVEIESQKTDKKKAEVMQKNSSSALKAIIGYGCDPLVKWLIPETAPPYRALPKAADQEGRLVNETRKLIYFVDSPDGRSLSQAKREEMFIHMLETIDPDDAVLLLRVKDKKLNIPIKAVKLGFPNLAKDW